tara:strand:- start:1460 stop:2602 length:1143 start_codon:yes stop_codon:yes gene_type:complete
MANIAIYDGSADITAVSGSTPFGLYDNDTTYVTASANTADWCARRLGYPITDIELQDEQFFACYEEAVSEYSAQVNRWNIRNNLLTAQGTSTVSYTHKLINPSLGRIIGLSKQYGTEAGSGGTVDWETGHFVTTASVQEYDLDLVLTSSAGTVETADIEVKRVFHHNTPAETRHYDPQFGSDYAMNSFGWGSTLGGIQYLALPIYDDMLKIQHTEFNDTVRKSHYTFELINNKIKVFPRPQSGYKFYIQYINTADRNTLVTSSYTSSVSDYSDIGYDTHAYSMINDPGVQWIRKYTLALVKQVLGSVRSKYSSIPIPGSETTLDGDTMRAEGIAEAEALIAALREDLEATSRRNMMEREQEINEFQQGMLNGVPLNIYIG